MFCRKCGTEFRAGARFCGKCGSPKPVIKPAAAKATTSSASAPKKVPETPKRSPETPKPDKKLVEDSFACYNSPKIVPQKDSLGE